MARKIKHTKTELKAQRVALRRFLRFLPMLQLKKQQLQVEIQAITVRIEEKKSEEDARRRDVDRWVELLSQPFPEGCAVSVERIEIETGNIAGVAIPILRGVDVRRPDVDLFATPAWVDDAQAAVEQLIRLRIERQVLEEQRRRIAGELRVTTQRVNLFEKVKIPECRENIRVIRIFLGDEQTAGVVRGKIAKSRTIALAAAAG